MYLCTHMHTGIVGFAPPCAKTITVAIECNVQDCLLLGSNTHNYIYWRMHMYTGIVGVSPHCAKGNPVTVQYTYAHTTVSCGGRAPTLRSISVYICTGMIGFSPLWEQSDTVSVCVYVCAVGKCVCMCAQYTHTYSQKRFHTHTIYTHLHTHKHPHTHTIRAFIPTHIHTHTQTSTHTLCMRVYCALSEYPYRFFWGLSTHIYIYLCAHMYTGMIGFSPHCAKGDAVTVLCDIHDRFLRGSSTHILSTRKLDPSRMKGCVLKKLGAQCVCVCVYVRVCV